MSTLHVRNVPEMLYSRIQHMAGEKGRSLSAEVIVLLEQALQDRERREGQLNLLAQARRHRFKPAAGTPSSDELLREDRER